jgi:hypothetical protein
MAAMQGNPHRYTVGLRRYFDREKVKDTYMVTLGSPGQLNKVDPTFTDSFQLQLVDSLTGAIEKGSDLYLYKVTDNTSLK